MKCIAWSRSMLLPLLRQHCAMFRLGDEVPRYELMSFISRENNPTECTDPSQSHKCVEQKSVHTGHTGQKTQSDVEVVEKVSGHNFAVLMTTASEEFQAKAVA